jgi:hypothetical protein
MLPKSVTNRSSPDAFTADGAVAAGFGDSTPVIVVNPRSFTFVHPG